MNTNMVAPTGPGTAVAHTHETGTAALASRERSLIEARLWQALSRPRDIMNVRSRLLGACARPRFAQGARYSIKRAGKTISDLSIRMAEEVWRSYPNIDVSERITHDDPEKLIVMVTLLDLETGSSRGVEVKVPKVVERKFLAQGQKPISQRMNSDGQVTYLVAANEDDIRMTTGSLVARARRNLLLDLLPSDIREEVEEAVQATLDNEEATDPTAARKRCADAFTSYGIEPQEVADVLLDGKSIASCTRAQLHFLGSILTSMREGEVTWKEVKAESLSQRTTAQSGPSGPSGPEASGPTHTAARVSGALRASKERREGAVSAPTQDPTPEGV